MGAVVELADESCQGDAVAERLPTMKSERSIRCTAHEAFERTAGIREPL
jgi:hypothetical protein